MRSGVRTIGVLTPRCEVVSLADRREELLEPLHRVRDVILVDSDVDVVIIAAHHRLPSVVPQNIENRYRVIQGVVDLGSFITWQSVIRIHHDARADHFHLTSPWAIQS